MSMKEQVAVVRREKMAQPYTLAGYRLIADVKGFNYRLVLRYEHERLPARYVTEQYTNQKAVFMAVANAPKQLEVES